MAPLQRQQQGGQVVGAAMAGVQLPAALVGRPEGPRLEHPDVDRPHGTGRGRRQLGQPHRPSTRSAARRPEIRTMTPRPRARCPSRRRRARARLPRRCRGRSQPVWPRRWSSEKGVPRQALRLPGGRVDDQLDRAVAAQVAVAEPGQPAVQPLAEARADLGPVQPGPGCWPSARGRTGWRGPAGRRRGPRRGVGDQQARSGWTPPWRVRPRRWPPVAPQVQGGGHSSWRVSPRWTR